MDSNKRGFAVANDEPAMTIAEQLPEPFTTEPLAGRLRVSAERSGGAVELYFSGLDKAIHLPPDEATKLANLIHKSASLCRTMARQNKKGR